MLKTWRDPYGNGYSTCYARKIEIKDGITVLVGCNGLGKTTLLRNIKEELCSQNIEPFYCIANDTNGDGHLNIGPSFEQFMASEGEEITIDLNTVSKSIGRYMETGIVPRLFSPPKTYIEKFKNKKERWLLFDSIDSGYSIDNIIDFKNFLELIKDDAKKSNLDLYIIIAANSYEMVAGEACLDVSTGKYISFDSYDDYKKFVLKTRKKKELRIAKTQQKIKKGSAK